MNLILASQSPYKSTQLKTLGLGFTCFDPQIIENHDQAINAEQLAMKLAEEKARAVFKKHPAALIIGSDQTATDQHGQLLTKPGDFDRAQQQLKKCSGGLATFHSAIALISQGFEKTWSVTTKVQFRTLSDAEIIRYLEADQPYDCAGSFKVESLGVALFSSINSTDPSALIGLPLISLCDNLRQCGWQIP